MPEPRSLQERKSDALSRLEQDKDLWIASRNASDGPWLVPLSFWWNGRELFIATVESNPTARNIMVTGRVRVVLGHTRDVVLIGAHARLLEEEELPAEYGDAYAAKCGWDPRESPAYRFFQVIPDHVESWRELNEHGERTLMRSGQWLI